MPDIPVELTQRAGGNCTKGGGKWEVNGRRRFKRPEDVERL
jgi:hypothetical protein